MTSRTIKYVLLLLMVLNLAFGSGCSKQEKKQNFDGEEERQPIFEKKNINTYAAEELPDYLTSQAGVFISAKNSRFVTFEVGIKHLDLVDFNGNIERIIDYAQPLKVDLATMPDKRLILFSNRIFASEYERLLITLDTHDMKIQTIEGETISTDKIFNFMGFDFTDDDLAIEVGINGNAGIFLTSNKKTQLTLHIDLDKSLKTINDENVSINFLRPSISVSADSQWPERFMLLTKGLNVDFSNDTIALNTGKNTDDDQYFMRSLAFKETSNIFYKGNRREWEHMIADPSIYALSDIRTDGENKFSIVSTWMSEKPILLQKNQQIDGQSFTFYENEAKKEVKFDHIMPLKPELIQSGLAPFLALGQQGVVVETLDEKYVVLSPLSITALAIAGNRADTQNLWPMQQLGNQFSYSERIQASPFLLRIESDVGERINGQSIGFSSYLVDEESWHFETTSFSRNNDQTFIIEQSEFQDTSLITSSAASNDRVVITLNAENITNLPAAFTDNQSLILNAETKQIKVTQVSAEGITTKTLGSYLEIDAILKPEGSTMALVNAIKLSMNKETKAIQAIDIVIYYLPRFYAALSSSGSDRLIDAGLTRRQKNKAFDRFLVTWGEALKESQDIGNEKVCPVDDGVELKIVSYCRFKKILGKTNEMVVDTAKNLFFEVSRNTLSVRHAFQQLYLGLNQSEANLLTLHVKGDQGYSPKILSKSTSIQRIQKIMNNFKKIYKLIGRIFPDLSLKNMADKIDNSFQKKPTTSATNSPDMPRRAKVKTQ